MMGSEAKRLKTDSDTDKSEDTENCDELLQMTAEEKLSSGAFACTNVAFVFGNEKKEKLFVNKEELIKVSPVFEKLFTSDFKEKTSKEIDLPGKRIGSFVNFLRLALPGYDEYLNDDVAIDVLPLVREYQTDALRKRIDNHFTEKAKERSNCIDNLIENIVIAEEFDLQECFEACVEIASSKTYTNLVKNEKFNDISQTTRYTIALHRWSKVDSSLIKFRENDQRNVFYMLPGHIRNLFA